MDKIQVIEKLFYYINAYFYLVLPLTYLIFKAKKGDSLILALYGIFCFIFLNVYYFLPDNLIDPYFFSYTFIEYSFFTWLIFSNIKSQIIKKVIILASILFLLFQVFSYYRFRGLRLDTVSIGIETILLFIYVIILFYEYFKSSKTTYIYNNHFFWIALGVLLYLGGTFFFNILANHISREQIIQYLKLTYVLEMIKTTLFAVAIGIFSHHYKDKYLQKTHVPYLDLDMN